MCILIVVDPTVELGQQSGVQEDGGPTSEDQSEWSGQQEWSSEGTSLEAHNNGSIREENHDVYAQLRRVKISEEVIQRLKELFNQDIIKEDELDVRAIEGLSEFSPEASMDILQQLADSNLDTVSNKSAYICGLMKSYRAKVRTAEETGLEYVGPDPEKIKQLIERTKYRLTVTPGQRKYGGPPPGWERDRAPGDGCEVRRRHFIMQLTVESYPFCSICRCCSLYIVLVFDQFSISGTLVVTIIVCKTSPCLPGNFPHCMVVWFDHLRVCGCRATFIKQ